MTKQISLSLYDETGKLTPLVIEAMKAGATSDHHPTKPETIVLTFKEAKDADAFEQAVKALSVKV